MSEKFSISSKLPGDEEINGLDELHPLVTQAVIANDPQIVCALVWLDFPESNRRNSDGEFRHKAVIRRIEPFGTVDKVPAEVKRLAQDLFEARTGLASLPFDEVEPKLAHVTVITGEGGDQ